MSQVILRENRAAFFVFGENTASTSLADAFPSDRRYSAIRTEGPAMRMHTPFPKLKDSQSLIRPSIVPLASVALVLAAARDYLGGLATI